MEILALVATFFAGLIGSVFIGGALNIPDAGTICAVAVMGAFILYEMRKQKK